jgi:hypothetical protein
LAPLRWTPSMDSHRTTLVFALALAILAAELVVEAQEAGPFKHDPLQGMEPSGRIPKVALPDDLPNPERWRYLPEGRIKPGISLSDSWFQASSPRFSSSSKTSAPVRESPSPISTFGASAAGSSWARSSRIRLKASRSTD